MNNWQSKLVSLSETNELVYHKDKDGFVIPDFSYAGYCNANKGIPDVPIVLEIEPKQGDNTKYIQEHIDYLGTLPIKEDGFRGALLLKEGIFEVYGTIYINDDGILLCGKGSEEDSSKNTIILAKGNSPDKRDVIVMGNPECIKWTDKEEQKQHVTTPKINVGDVTFEIENADSYEVGDQIMIYHPCSQGWVEAVKYGGVLAPKKGEKDNRWTEGLLPIIYNRYITKIRNNEITIDAPVYYTLDNSLSQSYVYKPDMSGTIYNVGLENIRIDIEISGNKYDENHAWQSIRVQSAENGWVRNCVMFHFGQSGIITNYVSRFTIENCKAIDPIGKIEGERGYNFNAYIYSQLILFKDCYARNGRHHYVSNGTTLTSGIVFLRCVSDVAYNANEGHRKWTTGMLYDNLKEINIRPVTGWRKYVYHSQFVLGLYNRRNYGTGHGWSAAHSVCWNCNMDKHYGKIVIQKPPTAQNYAIGCSAKDITGMYKITSNYAPGHIEGKNKNGLIPESLYEAQLNSRIKNINQGTFK